MLSTVPHQKNYVPGFESHQPVNLEVLGPLTENIAGHGPCLRWFRGNKGKTKNGHSVILKLVYDDISILLGGDLNTAAEHFLLESYSGLSCPPRTIEEERQIIQAARPVFQTDIAKCCHHGSADFSSTFLKVTNPIATIVSSGDEESHAHPRPDTLGTIGLFGRGLRPLIFSTELVRSTREAEPGSLRKKIHRLREKLMDETNLDRIRTLRTKLFELEDELLTRNVTTYGAINVRTDGQKVVLAYMLEQERKLKSGVTKWDIYRLEKRYGQVLEFISDK